MSFCSTGKTESKESVETYESLLAKNEVVQNEMIEAGSELKSLQDLAKQEKRDKEEQDQGADDEDLDAYMNKLKQSSG